MKERIVQYKMSGLDYVYLINPPLVIVDGVEFVDLPLEAIEKKVASAIIELGVPIRGKEFVFLRKVLGNRNFWSDKLGMSAAGILKWERQGDKFLSKINETAVRLICAEELNITLDSKWSRLVPQEKTPNRIDIAA